MQIKLASFVALAAAALAAIAQPSSNSPLSVPPNGPRSAEPTAFAITNATVHTARGEVVASATVLLNEGRIVSVGPGENLAGYRLIDASGLHVYAGFVDAWVQVESPDLDADAPGRHASKMVQPERDVLAGPGLTEGQAKELRDKYRAKYKQLGLIEED